MTDPAWLALSMPVKVHWIFPALPTAGCEETAHAVIAVGNGRPQLAFTKFVNAGVLSEITIVLTAVLEVFV